MADHFIVLIEDSADDEVLTLRALKRSGVAYDVVVLRDGAVAVAYLLGPDAPTPDLILLDLKLPKLDGLQVLQQLRADERTSLLPVVVLTSSNEERDLVASYRLGANSYIRKPVDFEQFAEAVRQLGLYWLVLNQKPRRTTV